MLEEWVKMKKKEGKSDASHVARESFLGLASSFPTFFFPA